MKRAMIDIDSLKQQAAQGIAEAQFILGVMYAEGQGVPQDYEEAVKWYRLAAEQGYATTQFYLGKTFNFRLGVLPRDYAIAYAWLNLATANCEPDKHQKYTKARDTLIQFMTPVQIAKGKRLSREWLENYKKK